MGRKGKIDINHAAPEDMQILAGIDYSAARAIVEFRAIHPFEGLEDLEKVPGIDEKSVRKLKGSAWFSVDNEPKGTRATTQGTKEEPPAKHASEGEVDINRAGAEELMSLPHIGERTAEAILAFRREHGKFKSLEDVEKIPGFGPRTVENLKDRIHF